MSKYKAIIFDLDGTLADTLGDLTVAMNKMLVSFGWPTKTREELRNNINRGGRRFVSQSMPQNVFSSEDDRIVDLAYEMYHKKYSEGYCIKTKDYAGIKEQIAKLKAAGYKVGVLSNKTNSFVQDIIANLFPDTFDAVVGHTTMPTKPDPMIAWKIAGDLGVTANECILVGDSDVDMTTANNSGMYPLGVTWGYRDKDVLVSAGAKKTIDKPEELFGTIEKINPKNIFEKIFKK